MGVPPIFHLFTPFLARKGDRGMVETIIEKMANYSRKSTFETKPIGAEGAVSVAQPYPVTL